MAKILKDGIVGTGFVGDIHHAAFKDWVREAEVVDVASPNNAPHFAAERGIPNAYTDYCQMLEDKEIDIIDIGIPNDLHCQVVLDAARAGKHVIIEKPLCVTLDEADQMIGSVAKCGEKCSINNACVYRSATLRTFSGKFTGLSASS